MGYSPQDLSELLDAFTEEENTQLFCWLISAIEARKDPTKFERRTAGLLQAMRPAWNTDTQNGARSSALLFLALHQGAEMAKEIG